MSSFESFRSKGEIQPPPTAPDSERGSVLGGNPKPDADGDHALTGTRFSLPPAVLADLRRSIAESAGPETADEVLFRLGRSFGESEARMLDLGRGDPRSRLELGLARVEELELGKVWLDAFESAPGNHDCRVAVRVLDPLQGGPESNGGATPNGATCGLTLGFVTGLVSVVTGLDVVSTPFQCSGCCKQSGCAFEIRPAHTWNAEPAEQQPPSGSARFFLHSLGPRMSEGDISLADLVENTGDAVVLIDPEDVIRFWNKGAEEMFHYPREDVVGRKVGFIVPPDLIESDELGWIKAKIAEEGILSNFITRRLPKDGPELTVSLTRTVLHDGKGRAVGSTAVIRDITAQVEAEKELAHRNHLANVGELAATVAHEIKNPLTGIYTAIQILSRSLPPEDDRKPIFDDVAKEIRRLDQIAKDLLGFSRPLVPKPTRTELRSFLAESLQSPGIVAEIDRHRLQMDVDEGCFVPIEMSLILPVIQNIVLNAAQAMEAGGLIHISSEETGGLVTIAIRDTGPGVPEDRLEAIFEPFFTRKARGTGLGLSIARKNVEAHGGTIRVENAPSGGARFLITLPTVTEA